MVDAIQKGYYEVHVNGVKVSQHSRQDKAITRLGKEQLKNIEAQVVIKQPKLESKIDMKLLQNLALTYGENSSPSLGSDLHPVLSNFRVNNTNKNRLYFDSSTKLILGNTFSGFDISGKTITGLTTTQGTTGHYFTVSSEFSWWDNNLIRYDEATSNIVGEGSLILHPFTLEYITNGIVEPDATDEELYVTDSASGGTGTESNPYTLQEAINNANSGTTIWLKAGDYGNIEVLLTSNALSTNPIKIIGYTSTPGDISTNMVDSFVYTSQAQAEAFIDNTVYPVITGVGGSNDFGFRLTNASNIIVKNMIVARHGYNFEIDGTSNNIVFENCASSNAQTGGSLFGRGFESTHTCSNIRMDSILSFDSALGNIYINGDYNLVTNSISASGVNENATDYYLAISEGGISTIVKDCQVFRVGSPSHQGHGTGAKCKERAVSYCLWDNVTVTNCQNGAYMVGKNTHDNVIKNCTITAPSASIHAGLVVRNGAYNCKFEYNYVENKRQAILLWSDTETADFASDTHVSLNNSFVNNIFFECDRLVQYKNTNPDAFIMAVEGTKIYFNSFVNNIRNSFLLYEDTTTAMTFPNNELKNNLIEKGFRSVGVTASSTDFLQEYNCYSNANGSYGVPSGTGNITLDAQLDNFVNFIPQNVALKAGVAIPSVKYARNNVEREDPPVIGAIVGI